MRSIAPLIFVFWAFTVGPALALEPLDTVDAWADASAQEKAALIEKLTKKTGPAALPIIKCVDDAAGVPDHSDLSIGDLVKGCVASKDDSQPV